MWLGPPVIHSRMTLCGAPSTGRRRRLGAQAEEIGERQSGESCESHLEKAATAGNQHALADAG